MAPENHPSFADGHSLDSATPPASTNTSYAGTGTVGGTGADATENAERVLGPAGMQFVETISDIIASGDEAAIKSLTNQVVSAIAPFIVCDGNNCTTVWTTEVATAGSSQTTTGIPAGSKSGVRTAGNTQGMPEELADATRGALDEVADNWERDVNPLLRRAERCTGEWPERTFRGDSDLGPIITPVLVRIGPAIQTTVGVVEVAGGFAMEASTDAMLVVPVLGVVVFVPGQIMAYGLVANNADNMGAGLSGLWNPYEEHETYGRKIAREMGGEGAVLAYDTTQPYAVPVAASKLLPKGPVNAIDDILNQADDLPPVGMTPEAFYKSLDAGNDKLDDVLKAMDKAEAENAAQRALEECFNKAVTDAGESVTEWLGQNPRIIRSTPASFNLMSDDKLRMFRLDFDGKGYPSHGHLQIRDSVSDVFRDAIPGKHHLYFQSE